MTFTSIKSNTVLDGPREMQLSNFICKGSKNQPIYR